jgi:hypothetical protein
MKKCGNCAELIQDDARACRFCGRKVQGNNSLVVIGVVAAVLVGAAILGSGERKDSQAPGNTVAAVLPRLAPAVVAQCRDALQKAQAAEIIKGRPQPNRINVEDRVWQAIDAETKDRMLQSVACDLWQTSMPPEGERVVAYGHRSGKRLQMLTSVGMVRE